MTVPPEHDIASADDALQTKKASSLLSPTITFDIGHIVFIHPHPDPLPSREREHKLSNSILQMENALTASFLHHPAAVQTALDIACDHQFPPHPSPLPEGEGTKATNHTAFRVNVQGNNSPRWRKDKINQHPHRDGENLSADRPRPPAQPLQTSPARSTTRSCAAAGARDWRRLGGHLSD